MTMPLHKPNLVPRDFLRRGEGGPTPSSAEKSPGNEVDINPVLKLQAPFGVLAFLNEKYPFHTNL